MSINFDIEFKTQDFAVDMKSGLESMQGFSDAVRYTAETILTKKTPERLSAKSSVRTMLKKNFKGSFIQTFSLEVLDDELRTNLRKISKRHFVELISYFLSEALYIENNKLSDKAQKYLNKLSSLEDTVVEKLRESSLERAHKVVLNFGYETNLRCRLSAHEHPILLALNDETNAVLQAQEANELHDIEAIITRLNIHTGNGRLQLKGIDTTIPFGFSVKYKEVHLKAKKVFSENLNDNNGVHDENEWKFLKLKARPIKLKNEKVIKYIIISIQ